MKIELQQKTESFLLLYHYIRNHGYIRNIYNKKYIKRIQDKKLRRIIKHAYNSSLYRDKFIQAGLTPKDILCVEDLYKFPILTKTELKEWMTRELKDNASKYEKWHRDNTSGSTGTPLQVRYTPYEHAGMMAKIFMIYKIAGQNIFLNTMFSISSPAHQGGETKSFIKKLGLAVKYRTSQLDEPKKIVEKFNSTKPDLLNANVSHILSMIEYAENNGIVLHQPKIVVSTAEKMTDERLALMRKHFGDQCTIMDNYGSIETGAMACNVTRDVYIKHFIYPYNCFIVKDEEGKKSNHGIIYITSLFQKEIPLINYELGDIVETREENGVTVICKVEGRQDDWIKFKDGTKVPFQHVYEMMSPIEGIIKYKAIQEDYMHLVLKCVKLNESYDTIAIEKKIQENAKEIFHDRIEVVVEWVDDIEVERNGKIRMLISKVQ